MHFSLYVHYLHLKTLTNKIRLWEVERKAGQLRTQEPERWHSDKSSLSFIFGSHIPDLELKKLAVWYTNRYRQKKESLIKAKWPERSSLKRQKTFKTITSLLQLTPKPPWPHSCLSQQRLSGSLHTHSSNTSLPPVIPPLSSTCNISQHPPSDNVRGGQLGSLDFFCPVVNAEPLSSRVNGGQAGNLNFYFHLAVKRSCHPPLPLPERCQKK